MNPSDENIYHALFTYTKALSVALGYRDLLTSLHSQRVHDLAMALGRHCGLAAADLGALKVSASFHDIGKIGIPDRILLKPAQFDDGEWDTMKLHAEIGEKIIAATEMEGAQRAAKVIRHHHEHFDGSGYPDRLAGEAIPICARIIGIVDSYDAMAVVRAYHSARPHRAIMEILDAETGIKHDPQLMQAFKTLIEQSPLRAAGA
ncbi:MAG TPA: HD domain-containing phosphohydrolase [Rhodocyclaceae bacterium]